MKTFKMIAWVMAVMLLCGSAMAGSSSSSTTVKDGKKITTKIKTDNKGTTTTTVITKDKEGNVTETTTVTDKDGKIISTTDPQAQAKADEAAKKAEESQAALAKAPKRGANDPIQTVLFQTVVSEDLRKMTEKQGGLFPFLRKEFEKDLIVKILDQKKVDGYAKDHDFKTGKFTSFSSFDHGPSFLPADIYVESFAKVEEKVGINKATKKLAKAPFLIYRAVISSEYSGQTWEVKEEGHILMNQQVTKEFAAKIKAIITGEAGAGIPADAAKYRRGGDTVQVESGKDAGEALRNLFKKKK